MVERRSSDGVAFYARNGERGADWWTVLHPPYTLWHLSYVVMGAALAPRLSWITLAGTVLAFFLAVGVAAHTFDELRGRPLNTAISTRTLWTVGSASLFGAAALGVGAIPRSGILLVPFTVVGVLLVLGYNLELFGGRLHTDAVFAAAWGGFPVLVGFFAQRPPLSQAVTAGAVMLAAAATGLSYTQRLLSTPARALRRRASSVHAVITLSDGTQHAVDRAALLGPLESALKALSITMPVLALALLLAHATR